MENEIVNTTLTDGNIVEASAEVKETPARLLSSEELEKQLSGVQEEVPVIEEKKEIPPAEKPDEKVETPPEVKQETVSKEDIEALRHKIEEQEKRIAAKERFNNRQATELGLLRKATPEEESKAIREANERYEEIYINEGRFAADEFMDTFRKERAAKAEAIKQEEEARHFYNKIEQNKTTAKQFVPDLETHVESLAALMQEDGASPESINLFKESPYIADPVLLFNMVKRAQLRSEVATVRQELDKANAKIAELQKKPGKLIEQINAATRSIDGKSAGTATPSGDEISHTPARRLTYAELVEAEKNFNLKRI